MIRIINAQGFPTLCNEAGVAFQMPHPLARELYRQNVSDKQQLLAFLTEWGGDAEGVQKLLGDEFETRSFQEGLNNLGLPLETLHDLLSEKEFFEAAHGRVPKRLALHPGELGVLATAFANEGKIPNTPLRPVRDEAARKYILAALELDAIELDDQLRIGGYR